MNGIKVTRRSPGRVGEIGHLAFNPEDGPARFTAQSAFSMPQTPDGAAPRESIEVRMLVFFD